METILVLIEKYGVATVLVAIIGVFAIGFLKSVGLFNKVPATKKRYFYMALDIVYAAAVTPIFCLIRSYDITVSAYFTYFLTFLTATLSVYAVYENVGLKALVKWLIGRFVVTYLDKNGYDLIADKVKELFDIKTTE